ncbi:MAG: DNA mismatch repair protein MutT [Bacteriovorax sp. MedPE-SWde]|nr:MAG: DNA mismatch repair protein MutT [Bacteriovorax sp. MedPE-SWde]
MRLLKKSIHDSIDSLENATIIKRKASRAIVLKGEEILLLFTKRYEDYSLPGGGIDREESAELGMIRELQEETGSRNIRNIIPFGIYEEYRPWYKPEFDVQHMISYCFTCEIDSELGETSYEDYEINNGMKPVWINIHEAIAHNEETIAKSEKKGMSIERENFLLKLIVKELL